jgi:hypothetical protein
MTRQRDPWITEYVEIADAMFDEGITDPSAEEIAERYANGRAVSPRLVGDIRQSLRRLRVILESEYNRPVSLVNDTYYSDFRHSLLMDDATAKQCVARGNGNGAAGLRLRTGDDDLIYQATLEVNYASGTGKIKKNSNRLLDATANGNLPKPRAAFILNQVAERVQPDNRELAQQVMGFLEAPPD